MDLGRQPSTGVSQRFPISRLGLVQFQSEGAAVPLARFFHSMSPLWIAPPPSTRNRPRPPQAGQRKRRQARRGEHQQRGGVRGRRWSRLRATTPPPRRHSHAEVLPTPPPTCRRQTNADAGVDGLPRPVGNREIPPRRPCPGPPQHPVDHRSVIPPRTPTPRRPIRQQRLQHSPLSIGQVMAIMHTGLPTATGLEPLQDTP